MSVGEKTRSRVSKPRPHSLAQSPSTQEAGREHHVLPDADFLHSLYQRVEAVRAKAGPRATTAFRAALDAIKTHPADSPEAREAIAELGRWVEREEQREPGLIVPLSTGDDPRESRVARTEWHGHTLAGLVYTRVLRAPVHATVEETDQPMRDDILDTAVQHVRDTVEAMQPRDPIERQLIEQLVIQHARFLSLSQLAAQQSELEPLTKIHEAADRVANTHRRLAAALAEYRNPRPIRAMQFIKQQNNAQQQVVQNGTVATLTPKNATNEQGRIDEHPDASALLPDTQGIGIATGGSAAREALEAEYRPADA